MNRKGEAFEKRIVLLSLGLALSNFWAASAMGAAASEAIRFKDVTGSTVRLLSPPQRIVTLAPSLGELAMEFTADHPERIVGVSEFTDFPTQLKNKQSVGPYQKVNLEKVISLKPDLVIATLAGNARDQIERLRELKVPVLVVASESVSEIAESLSLVGKALGNEERGKILGAELLQQVKSFRTRAAGLSARPRVLLQLGDDPLIVVGGKSFLAEALSIVGAENVYGDSKAGYPKPSREDVLTRKPEVILVLALDEDTRPFEAMVKTWSFYPRIPAVKSGQVKVLQGDTLLRPTPRLMEGLRALYEAVHGKS